MEMQNITQILEIAVRLIAAVVSIILIPLIKAKTNESQRKKITAWVNIAVQAAEEAERTGLIDKSAKYHYAVELLERNGITFDTKTMQGVIDSTVWELFNQFKEDAEKGD